MIKNMIELHAYEKVFKVKRKWLKRKVKSIFGIKLKEFLIEYTWDDAELIYNLAINEKMI